MNKPSFDWTLIRSFLAALDEGSLMGAARATGLSQPTLGRHIVDLEQRLGIILFERTGRGLTPTRHAIALADAARTMEAGASTLLRIASGKETALRGAVRVSASQPIACVLLPPLIARMREALPEIYLELVVSNAVSNLLRREADIALRMVRPDQSSLVTRRIGTVNISACAHKDYLRRTGRPRRPQDLYAHQLIGGDKNDDIERGFALMGFATAPIRFSLRTDDLMAQWGAIRASLGIGFTPNYLIANEPDVSIVLPKLKLPRYPIWLTVHREIRTSARIRAVYDYLAEHVANALKT